jgi:NAD-dependent DNA ligase
MNSKLKDNRLNQLSGEMLSLFVKQDESKSKVAQGFEKTEAMQFCQIIYSMAVMRTTKNSDKSLAKEFFYLEKLIAPHVKSELPTKSLTMLLYGFDTGVLHSHKLLESVQT